MERFVLIPESMWKARDSSLAKVSKAPTNKLQPDMTKIQNIQQMERIRSILPKPVKPLPGPSKYERILMAIDEHPRISPDEDDSILLDGQDTGIGVVQFIKVVGETRKNPHEQSEIPDSFAPLLELLQLSPKLRTNRNAVKTASGAWSTFSF